jgi:molecular chaperone DnaJ
MQTKPDYYGVLGVSRQATAPEIRAAFQKLATAFHAEGKPKNIDDVEEIRKYATAYRVLSDAKKREYYDRTGFHPLEAELAAGMHPVAQKVEGFWGGVDAGDIVDVASMVLEIFAR